MFSTTVQRSRWANDDRRYQQALNQGELHGSSPRIRGLVTTSITIRSREVW